VKTYQIQVNDRTYTVEIDNPHASPVTVRVNGRPFKVTMTPQGTAVQAPVTTGQEMEIEGSYVPVVTTTFVEMAPELEAEPSATPSAAPATGEGVEPIVAPMPGKIMDIMVKVGDRVRVGDTLCNLEAMKMKSPIRSTSEGTVSQILINEGQNVNYGDVLFTLH
jgi:biotin carboxyl carrier protein